MENNFDEFTHKLINAVKVDYLNILNTLKNESPYAVALVIDDSITSLYLTLNTNEYLESEVKEHMADYRFYKWDVSYWKYGDSMLNESKISAASDFLYLLNESNKESIESFKKKIFDAMISALAILKNEPYFDNNIVLFISLSDDSEAELIENCSANLLNNKNDYENFLMRFDTDDDIRNKAKDAWDTKNYSSYINLMKKIKDNLTELESKKIFLATKRLSDKN